MTAAVLAVRLADRACVPFEERDRLMHPALALATSHPVAPTRIMDDRPPASRDAELVGQMARGDEGALGRLYDRYGPVLYAVAFRVVGEQADAEEVVMEAFAQAWREAGRFDAERGSAAAWLTMMTRSRALDRVRARSRRARLTDAAAGETPGSSPAMSMGAPEPSRGVEQDERARAVAAALAALSPPQRQAIELAYYQGLSQSEIAEHLREPLGTIKTRMRLGMQKLRDVLRPYYFEGAV